MGIPDASIVEFLADWCIECDSYFDGEDLPDWAEPTRCSDAGHHRGLTQDDLRWVICDRCHGDGELGGYPGAYTQDEFYEAFGDDPAEYLDHRRACEDCRGSGKIRMITDEALARPAVTEALKDHYDDLATRRGEMGWQS